ncbi:MAG: hypothetical protein A2675_00430 [Candidatus Yonathbacteria bacterium RIFCSPHIGHO2_01_FULL_51_10]|uniref:Type II secretion system protein GspG C-terminal domain-containing protein n=1 Tax=Candidatus Yonathbacteria bacterium RIFCSPHIGHO2_01_FULL_51_10 TaxID=1802723 RepID=A0A1G2SB57_9BACT|nr:MAG: hypothetical protein A2675_00430 [Candidatus Yonathbacteria bacterium RIFCSPHIGHO2_01_FULL_51_10]
MRNSRGFTLIELLVVIAIIGILASTVLSSLSTAREKAKISRAQSELRSARTAITMLENDTGKWPNGCPVNAVSNPEVNLDSAQAGVKVIPTAQDNGDGCEWTSADIANWRGPYMQVTIDPWENAYDFDPDYKPGDNEDGSTNCDGTSGAISEIPAVVSYGSDGIGRNEYNCDDVYYDLQ